MFGNDNYIERSHGHVVFYFISKSEHNLVILFSYFKMRALYQAAGCSGLLFQALEGTLFFHFDLVVQTVYVICYIFYVYYV